MSGLADFPYLANLPGANYGMWNSPTPGLTLNGQIQPGEGGVDIGVSNGTPVLAIGSGSVIAAGYWNDSGHGVVTIRTNVPGVGPQDLYYQHIQIDRSIRQSTNPTRQYIQRGQQIGVIGPYNEIEMGFNSLWGGVWGTNHPGAWIRDPRPWLNAIINATPATTAGTIYNTAPSGTYLSGGLAQFPSIITENIGSLKPSDSVLTTLEYWDEVGSPKNPLDIPQGGNFLDIFANLAGDFVAVVLRVAFFLAALFASWRLINETMGDSPQSLVNLLGKGFQALPQKLEEV